MSHAEFNAMKNKKNVRSRCAPARGSKVREDRYEMTEADIQLRDRLIEIRRKYGSFEAFFKAVEKRERRARSNKADNHSCPQ